MLSSLYVLSSRNAGARAFFIIPFFLPPPSFSSPFFCSSLVRMYHVDVGVDFLSSPVRRRLDEVFE
jgi:hypothetical protein